MDDCQPCPQAVGSVDAALLTGRAAESRGVALLGQSAPLEGFFSPLGSAGKTFEVSDTTLKSLCRRKAFFYATNLNIYLRIRCLKHSTH